MNESNKNIRYILYLIIIFSTFVYVSTAQSKDSENTIRKPANTQNAININGNPLSGIHCNTWLNNNLPEIEGTITNRGVTDFQNMEIPIWEILSNPHTEKISTPTNSNVKKKEFLLDPGDIIDETDCDVILRPGEFSAFSFDTEEKSVEFIPNVFVLAEECYQALEQAPDWLKHQLTNKFRVLQNYKLADDYARLIIEADINIKDEVAFQVANISKQTLVNNSRFKTDKSLIVKNAEMIYKSVDSLHYVELVEYGNYETGDYYTTTRYRIYDPSTNDTTWVEAPKEIYYWYIVHPKIRQEQVASQDSPSSLNQRTYNYFWRDYFWSNPNPDYDYTTVSTYTNFGSIEGIQRFGELMQKPTVLWDRVITKYPFLRDYEDTDNAIDVIGNWTSQAIPLLARNPRPIQPNQILFEPDGNCGEDAIILVAACRTALIPCLIRSIICEDHVYTAFWETGWNHYEFFRGGLEPEAEISGATNLDANYEKNGWNVSCCTGFRPDGYPLNHTIEYVQGECTIKMNILDADNKPVDGAQFILFAPVGENWWSTFHDWTGVDGKIEIKAGARNDGNGKEYAYQIFHPYIGTLPSSNQVWYLTDEPAEVGKTYEFDFVFPDYRMPKLKISDVLESSVEADFGISLSWEADNIIASHIKDLSGFNWDNFYFWDTEPHSGAVSFFLCDEANYELFKDGDEYDAYKPMINVSKHDLFLALPSEGKWYAVFTTKTLSCNLQNLKVDAKLLEGPMTSVQSRNKNQNVQLSPNPFSNSTTIKYSLSQPGNVEINIYNAIGDKITTLSEGIKDIGEHSSIFDASNLPQGMYYYTIQIGDKLESGKMMLVR